MPEAPEVLEMLEMLLLPNIGVSAPWTVMLVVLETLLLPNGGGPGFKLGLGYERAMPKRARIPRRNPWPSILLISKEAENGGRKWREKTEAENGGRKG